MDLPTRVSTFQAVDNKENFLKNIAKIQLKMDSLFRNNRVRAFKNKINNDFHYFSHFPWQFVHLLEKYAGTWPYQTKVQQFPRNLLHHFALISISSAVLNKMLEFIRVNDVEMTLECIVALAFLVAVKLKFIAGSVYQRSRKILYEKISEQFEKITNPEEAMILKKFADDGFKYAIIYIFSAGIICCIFDGIPVIQCYYRYYFVTGQLNIKLPLQLDYGFDHKTYWYIVTMDFLLFVVCGFIVDCAYDLSFILQVRHAQALFKIVGMRLNKVSELVSNVNDDAMSLEARNAEAYSLISSAIDLHSECLEIVSMIEDSSSITLFVILLINTSMFAAGTHLVSLRLHDPVETVRNVVAYALVLMHFQIIFSQGQRITDASIEVADFCYGCKWYNLRRNSCKLLMAMMTRTSIPCVITGAQFFTLSIETFGIMLKAGVSYYTVFEA